MNSREFQEKLAERAGGAGLRIPAELGFRLEAYYRLLASWNKKINLSGLDLTEPTDVAFDRLLVEPVVAAQHAPSGARRTIDIGSGGGSPAIPFALALSGPQLLMVESKTRKSVFLREALRAVGLHNGEVATARFEELLAAPGMREAHDLLTIRAVRVEEAVLGTLNAFVRPGGHLFLFRAEPAVEDALPSGLSHAGVFPLIPSMGSHLVVLEKTR